MDGVEGDAGSRTAGVTVRRLRHPLVGRTAELGAIVSRLRSGKVPLITITGRAGSGRTRLGMAALDAVEPDLPGGAAIVSMAGMVDRGTLLSALAVVLELSHEGGTNAEAAVEQRLLQLPTAILCDDADGRGRLLEALSALVGAGGGRLLATADRPLGVPGEHVVRLDALGLPAPTDDEPEVIARAPAVRLYLTHAQAADHRFAPDAAGMRVIAEVCRRLDGLPGAIELAAGRVTLLPPARLLERLDRAPLDAGVRRPDQGPPGRPTALGAAIASIHETLDRDAMVVLRRVAILHGPAPLDGLEQIAADPDWAPDRLLDAVADLIDCHLLEASPDAEPRFWLPASVLVFARTRLDEAGERALVGRRRNEWCLAAMHGRVDHFDAPPPPPAMDDLLAGLEDLLAGGDLEGTLRLAGGCAPTWSHEAWPPVAERLTAEAIARAMAPGASGVAPDVLLRARIWQARLTTERSDAPTAADQAATFRDVVADARTLGDPQVLLLALASLTLAVPFTQDFAAAAAAVQEGLPLAASVGDTFWATRFLYWSGMMAVRFGDRRTAVMLGGQGLAAAMASGDRVAIVPAGLLLLDLANVGEVVPPNTPSPEELLDIARATSRTAQGWVLASMAHAAAERGDLAVSVARCIELIRTAQRGGAWTGMIAGFSALAVVAAEREEHAVAARLCGMFWRDLPTIVAVTFPERAAAFMARLERAREAAGQEIWDRHLAAGAALPPADAAHEALSWARSVLDGREPEPGADAEAGGETTEPGAGTDGQPRVEPLTPREEQVLARIARGESNKEIAQELGLSAKTVMHHSMSIYRKLGVRGRSEATAWAFRRGRAAS